MTKIPTNLVPLIDGDILRYEVGFAAEAGWKAMTEGEDNIPPFHYVEALLLSRIDRIVQECETKEIPEIFLTEGKTFRYDLAKTKPYKATRKENKPWHYDNLTQYMYGVLNAVRVTGIEADDAIAINHVASPGDTIICSRDKDLRQVPGWCYSWELGRQPSFGPELVTKEGTIRLSDDRKSLKATGLAAFYGQILTGDRVDNIPGLDKCGPVAAYNILSHAKDMFSAVEDEYMEGVDGDYEDLLLEQGRLCWMTRRLHEDGSPVLWEIGMEE